MKWNQFIALIVALWFFAFASVPTHAHELSEQTCKDLGRTLELLAKQNLEVVELRERVAKLAIAALIENTVVAAERQTAIEETLGGLGDTAFEAKELVPGIRAFRAICQ